VISWQIQQNNIELKYYSHLIYRICVLDVIIFFHIFRIQIWRGDTVRALFHLYSPGITWCCMILNILGVGCSRNEKYSAAGTKRHIFASFCVNWRIMPQNRPTFHELDVNTCFIGRWGNVKYSVRCYYFSLFWLHNQLKLVSLCFMYHDDDDVPILHDFIRFYPAFPTVL